MYAISRRYINEDIWVNDIVCISFFHFDLHVVKLSKTDYLHRKTNLKYFITTNKNIKKKLKSPN